MKNLKYEHLEFVLIRLSESEQKVIPHGAFSDNVNSFVFLEKGEVMIKLNNHSLLIRERELLFIPRGNSFEIQYFNKSLGYMGGFLSEYVNGFDDDFVKKLLPISLERASFEFIGDVFKRLLYEANLNSRNDLIIKSYFQIIFNEVRVNPSNLDKSDVAIDDVGNKKIESFFNCIFSETEKKTVSFYASKLNITTNHLNKLVKNFTNKSASRWIDDAFLYEAKSLIRMSSSSSFAEISEKLGILDPSYFARKFKKLSGMSPSEYKKRLKN